MGMTRAERISLHKSARYSKRILKGVPKSSDVQEGVTELRKTNEGIVEYTKHNNVLFKKILDKA